MYSEKYSNYHWCTVHECQNTSIKTPGKLWIKVPSETNVRNAWLNLARRDPSALSKKTQLYFCEDHFDLQNDMENYIQYKLMGSVKRIRMRLGCMPSRFDCQHDRKREFKQNGPKLVCRKRKRNSFADAQEPGKVKVKLTIRKLCLLYS